MKKSALALLFILFIGGNSFAANKNKVLVVSSYGADYQSANDILSVIDQKVKLSFPGVEINIEYLSSEMFTKTDNWLLRMKTILSSYRDDRPLAIILISDEAWMAYRGANTSSFRDVPLLLCAVKPHSITMQEYSKDLSKLKLSDFERTTDVMKEYNSTGVLRRMNIEGYLRLMQDVLPRLDNFLFITDKRFYGTYTQLLLKDAVPTLYPNYPAEYINSLTTTTDSLIRQLNTVGSNTGLLMTSWLTGEHGYEYSKDYIYKHMESVSDTPIFLTNDLGLHKGYFVGGYFNQAGFWGDICAKQLIDVIKGNNIGAIPIETYNDVDCNVDWRIVVKYNLNPDHFPVGTIFHNHPESIFAKYQNYIVSICLIFVLIFASFIYIVRSHLRLKKAQKTTLLSVELANKSNERLRETRKNLTIALEKAEESDRLKSSFIANMSHEIRTPLNAIVGFSSIIATMDSEQERVEFADIIQRNSELLLQLISDILEISRLESGMFDFSYESVDASSICMDVVVAHQSKCNPSVELSFLAPEEPLDLHTDSGHVIQILTNFVLNAIKFTPTGKIEIGYQSYNKEMVEFYVKDTGIGINSDKISTIFDRFVKLNTYVEGTGLGLALCKTIVDVLGGQIGVDSKLGEGSRFWFRISKKMNY